MAFRKRRMRRRRPHRRRLRRRHRRFRANPQIGLPSSRILKMRYNDSFNIGTVTTVGQYAFARISCTNINSPVFGGGSSHLPLGLNQAAVYWQNYIVVGSKITYTATCGTSNNTVLCGLMTHDDSSIMAAEMSTLVEQGRSRWKAMQGAINGNVARLSQKFSTKKWFGLSKLKDNLALYGAPFGTSPPKTAYWVLWFGTLPGPGSTASTSVTVNYTVDYLVLCFEPSEMPQSI